MRDPDIIELAARQFNRVARPQLLQAGYSSSAIDRRLVAGHLVTVEEGVYACPPVLDDPWGRWMGASLTSSDTYVSHETASVAYGWLMRERALVTVTRPGRAGPRVHGGLLVYRRPNLAGEVGSLRGVAITSPERTLLDLAATVSSQALARALREAVRLRHTTLLDVASFTVERRQRRGASRLLRAAARYSGLPLERARSGAEVAALLVFRDAGYEVPALNRDVCGVEADLHWRRHRLIVEVDGGPFHLDRGADAERQAHWEAGGWTVRRIPSDDVYERPERLLALAPEAKGP